MCFSLPVMFMFLQAAFDSTEQQLTLVDLSLGLLKISLFVQFLWLLGVVFMLWYPQSGWSSIPASFASLFPWWLESLRKTYWPVEDFLTQVRVHRRREQGGDIGYCIKCGTQLGVLIWALGGLFELDRWFRAGSVPVHPPSQN